MKKELKKKLKKYSSVSSLLVVANSSLHGQISYTDVNPDIVVSPANFYDTLDLNLDAIDDIVFGDNMNMVPGTFSSGPYSGQYYNLYLSGAAANGLNGAELAFVPSSMVDALNSNDPINVGISFNNNTSGGLSILGVKTTLVAQSTTFTSYNYFGNWHGQVNKYLGIRFPIGANNHYGWIRMSVTSDCDSIIIKDYAYNTVPNQGILAGQTAVSVAEMESEISIHAYQKSLYIRKNAEEQEQLQIFSLDGKMVFEKTVSDKNEIVSLQDLPEGVYVVQFGELAKKIVL